MKTYIIKNKLGKELNTISEWKEGFLDVDQNQNHWRPDYSAHSLGVFFTKKMNNGYSIGQTWLDGLVEIITGSPFEFNEAEIEHPSKVDNLRGGQRMQDLTIWGESAGKSIFVAIEAKVLESFDKTILDAYNDAVKYKEEVNARSMKDKRIEDLVARFFPNVIPTDESIKNLRYQLFHYVAASEQEGSSIVESNKGLDAREKPQIVILPVIVFKTPHYFEDTELAKENRKDYFSFMESIGFQSSGLPYYHGSEILALKRKSQILYSIYAEVEI